MKLVPSPQYPVEYAKRRLPQPLAVLELLKPVTWFPPMWAFLCGAVSSGVALFDNLGLVIVGIILAGPLVCAMSQAINDWHDRHVDAINEPDRPIPSGRVPGRWGLFIAFVWTILSVIVASALGEWVLVATLLGLFLAWGYSAPPLRFKNNGWIGNGAVGLCYEGLAWFTGAAVLLGGLPPLPVIALALLYSIGAHGIMTLNDFKSIAGDREQGVRTLPVQLGAHRAAIVAGLFMAFPQVLVIALLWSFGAGSSALIVFALLALQLYWIRHYLLDKKRIAAEPKRVAALYNMTGVTAFVTGMMVSAVGIAGVM